MSAINVNVNDLNCLFILPLWNGAFFYCFDTIQLGSVLFGLIVSLCYKHTERANDVCHVFGRTNLNKWMNSYKKAKRNEEKKSNHDYYYWLLEKYENSARVFMDYISIADHCTISSFFSYSTFSFVHTCCCEMTSINEYRIIRTINSVKK